MGIALWQLISGDEINISGIGTIVQPHLRDLKKSTGVGYDKYLQYVNTFLLDVREQAIDIPEMRETCERMDAALRREFTTYDFYLVNDELTDRLLEAVQFFVKEDVTLCPENGTLVISDRDKIVGVVSHENYNVLADTICNVCHLDIEREVMPKNKSKRFLDLWFKRRAGRKAMRKSVDKDISVENLVSAICARHHSYNYLNIWDLTVYQLYDTFQHMHTNEITDRMRLKWAAWGKDEWENDKLWYASNNKS